MQVFCGIDWAEGHHDVALVDESGRLVTKKRMLDAHPPTEVLTSNARHRCQDRRANPARSRRQQQLEHAFFLAAFAALADPVSRAHYDRKRAQGNATTLP